MVLWGTGEYARSRPAVKNFVTKVSFQRQKSTKGTGIQRYSYVPFVSFLFLPFVATVCR